MIRKQTKFAIVSAALCLLLTINIVICQDDDEEYEESEEDTTTKSSKSAKQDATTQNPLSNLIALSLQGGDSSNAKAINALVQTMLKNREQAQLASENASSDNPLVNITIQTPNASSSTSTGDSSANGAINPAILSALVQVAMLNRQNIAAAPAAVPVSAAAAAVPEAPEVDTDSLDYIMGQVNKIIESVSSGNISGIIENSLRIRAPSAVQAVLTNILTYLNSVTFGAFGLGFPTSRPTPRPGGALLRNNPSCVAAPAPATARPPSRAAIAGTFG